MLPARSAPCGLPATNRSSSRRPGRWSADTMSIEAFIGGGAVSFELAGRDGSGLGELGQIGSHRIQGSRRTPRCDTPQC